MCDLAGLISRTVTGNLTRAAVSNMLVRQRQGTRMPYLVLCSFLSHHIWAVYAGSIDSKPLFLSCNMEPSKHPLID